MPKPSRKSRKKTANKNAKRKTSANAKGKTSTPQTSTPKKPEANTTTSPKPSGEPEVMASGIAEILDNVEQLIALHQDQENQTPAKPADIATDEIVQSVETQFKARFDQLEKQIESMSGKIESVSQLTGNDSGETDNSSFDAFAENTAALIEKLETKLENVDGKIEMVSELISDQSTGLDQSAFQSFFADNTAELIGKVESRLGTFDDKIEKVSQLTVGQPDNFDQSAFEAFAEKTSALVEKIETKLDSVDEKIESLSELTSQQSDESGDHAEWNDRYEALDQRVSKIYEVIEAQQQLIETQNTDGKEKVDSLVNSVQIQFDHLLDELTKRLKNNADDSDESEEAESTNNLNDDSASHWSKQKAAMLSKYGINPEHRPDLELPSSAVDPVKEVTEQDQGEKSSAEETLKDILKTISPEDADVVHRLKEELNSKLQAAEVELSIERAKLSQFNAKLESKQVELERSTELLNKKYEEYDRNSVENKMGMLERLKRHLNAKDRKNLDRM